MTGLYCVTGLRYGLCSFLKDFPLRAPLKAACWHTGESPSYESIGLCIAQGALAAPGAPDSRGGAEGGVGNEDDRLARENELLDKQRNVELLLELIERQPTE